MKPETFLFEARDGVGVITLNRPEKLNALTLETYAELRDFMVTLRGEASVRAVVLTGSGRGFCSGGDINAIIGELVQWKMEQLLEFTRMTGALVQNILQLPKPVIAAVNGAAAGAGAVIALACDVRIVVPEASFAFLFPKVGLSGADMGAAYLLPRTVGLGRARRWLLTGEKIDAPTAVAAGLADPAGQGGALETALELAQQLAAHPRQGVAMTKEMINSEMHLSLEQAIEAESQAQAICMANPDFLEAYNAFKERRKPKFD